MFKLLLVCTVLVTALAACEKQKQASAEVGAIPKQIIDKATNDINNAAALDTEKMKAAASEAAPDDSGK